MSVVLAGEEAAPGADLSLVAENAWLRQALSACQEDNARLKAQVAELTAHNAELEAKCQRLEGANRQQAQARFGRKSEQSTSAEAASAQQAAVNKRGQQRGRRGHGRHHQDQLPTFHEQHRHQPAPCCARCQRPYKACGEEIYEEVDWRPGLRRVVHHRQKYVQDCRCEGVPRFITAPRAASLIPRSPFTARLLAKVIVDKCLWGQPLNRQSQALALEGAHLAPGSMVGVLGRLQPMLQPVTEAIAAHNRHSTYLHVDETRWRKLWLLRGGNTWLWVFVGEDSTVYLIADSRGHQVVLDYLGLSAEQPAAELITLICDFMKAYDALGELVARQRCWSHYRRLILECRTRCRHDKAVTRWVDQWLEMVDDLFHLWYERRQATTAEGREDADLALRGCVEEMEAVRAEQLQQKHLPADARRVLTLAQEHWAELVRCVADPAIAPDNNAAERAARTPVVLRKNCYGSGAPWAATFLAQAWTILLTMKQNGLNPLSWLVAYLMACAEAGGRPPTDLAAWLPWSASEQDRAAWSRPLRVEPG